MCIRDRITVEAKDYILNYAKKNKMGEPKKIIEVNSPMSQVDLVKRGLGVAVVSNLLVEGDRTLNRLAVPHFKNEHMYITSHNSKLIADHIQSLKKMIEDHAKQMA